MEMSFHDDSHILSRLGILESTEESPRNPRNSLQSPAGQQLRPKPDKEAVKFVDVAIDDDSVSEDDIVIDKDTLLNSTGRRTSRVRHRRTDSYLCRFIVLTLVYIGLGLVLHSSPDVLAAGEANGSNPLIAWHCLGTLFGVFVGKICLPRFNITILLLISTLLLVLNSWILYGQKDPSIRISSFVQGFAIGASLYGGLATWFLLWRSHNRQLFFLYALISLGAGIALVAKSPATMDRIQGIGATDASAIPHLRVIGKRDADVASSGDANIAIEPVTNETVDSVTSDVTLSNETDSDRPKKPQTAVGAEVGVSKTEVNQVMRSGNQTDVSQVNEAANVTDTETAENSNILSTPVTIITTTTAPPTVTTTTTTRTTTTTTITTTSTLPTTTKSSLLVWTTAESPSVITKSALDPSHETFSPSSVAPHVPQLSEIIAGLDPSLELLVLCFLAVSLLIQIMGFACCCLSHVFRPDARLAKLCDTSLPGLTVGCRLRLGVFYFIIGMLDCVVLMWMSDAYQNDEGMGLGCTFRLIARIVAVLIAPVVISPFATWVLMGASSVGSLMAGAPAGSFLVNVLLSTSTSLLPLVVLLNINSRLNPRGVVLLDYAALGFAGGRWLAAVVCALLSPLSAAGIGRIVLIMGVGLLAVFYLLQRSINKAVRLKEIMDYSSPVPEVMNSGEYFSLSNAAFTDDEADDGDSGSELNMDEVDEITRAEIA